MRGSSWTVLSTGQKHRGWRVSSDAATISMVSGSQWLQKIKMKALTREDFTKRYDVVVVGAGHAGAQAAIALRQHKFVGTIAIVGDEPDLPYERPPLSKDYLSREKQFEQILLRPSRFWPGSGERDCAEPGLDSRVSALP